MDKIDIRDLTLGELRTELEAMGEKPFRAAQIFSWIYQKGATRFEELTELSRTLRVKLETRFAIGSMDVVETLRSGDGTEKFLFRLRDGPSIESVLIPAGRRMTICLSTQAGCRFACAFCASGLHGFKRNLTASEITGQILHLRNILGHETTNYVFMGMGEPLDNWDNVEKAIRIMNAPEGLGIAARRMTVSTAGPLPGLTLFGKLDLQVNLSLSLHAVTDRLRSTLMPINRKYPLESLIEACEAYVRSGGRMITLEYIVIAGLNDSLNDADGLAGIARRLRAKVNLIAYSPVAGLDFKTPGEGEMRRFRRLLEERRLQATVRSSKGRDIAAACGQLAGRFPEQSGPGDSRRKP